MKSNFFGVMGTAGYAGVIHCVTTLVRVKRPNSQSTTLPAGPLA